MSKLASIFSLIGLSLITLSIGCGGPKANISQHDPDSRQEADRRFDPLELEEDLAVIPNLHPRGGVLEGRYESNLLVSDSADSLELVYPIRPSETVDTLYSQAFRVQLFTSKLYGEAKHAVRVAEEIFDHSVYLDYEVPYYKVRVGSFAQRDDAEDYQQRVRAAGYSNAWVVLVNVKASENNSPGQELESLGGLGEGGQ